MCSLFKSRVKRLNKGVELSNSIFIIVGYKVVLQLVSRKTYKITDFVLCLEIVIERSTLPSYIDNTARFENRQAFCWPRPASKKFLNEYLNSRLF